MIAALELVGLVQPEAPLARIVTGRGIAVRAGEVAGERAIVATHLGTERA